MSTTDDALAWLLSLSATCTNSPTSPDFTDWFHISPTNTTLSSYHSSTSPPFQESLHRPGSIYYRQMNFCRTTDRKYFADQFTSDGVASSSDSGRSYNSIGFDSSSIPTSVQQLEMFNQHNRMLSLGSTSASTTLINTPSPRSLTGFQTALGFSIKSPFSPNLFVCSPGTKFMQELQYSSSFGAYYDLIASSEVAPSISDLSPVCTSSNSEDPPFNYCPA